jgi:hypothetical protein
MSGSRRLVVLVSMALYTLGSIGCALADGTDGYNTDSHI